MYALLKRNLEYSMMHSELWCHALHNIIVSLLAIQRNKVANEWLIHNSTTRTLLLKERTIIRTQIYESQSFSKNKEQTWDQLLRWESESMRISIIDSQRLWIYQEFKSHTIFDVSSTIKVQVTYNLEKSCINCM